MDDLRLFVTRYLWLRFCCRVRSLRILDFNCHSSQISLSSALRGVSVVVVDGIVQFWGVVDSHEQGEALRVAAGNVPGVKGVELNVSSIPAYAWGV